MEEGDWDPINKGKRSCGPGWVGEQDGQEKGEKKFARMEGSRGVSADQWLHFGFHSSLALLVHCSVPWFYFSSFSGFSPSLSPVGHDSKVVQLLKEWERRRMPCQELKIARLRRTALGVLIHLLALMTRLLFWRRRRWEHLKALWRCDDIPVWDRIVYRSLRLVLFRLLPFTEIGSW